MDRKLIEQIARGDHEEGIEQFDNMAFSGLPKEPSLDFTAKIMKNLPARPSKQIGYQFWGLMAGLVVVLVLWGMDGFYVPDFNVAFEYFGFNKSFEMTGMLKGFMMINALLVILLIDRAVQRRRKAV